MIFLKNDLPLKIQLNNDIKELKKYKSIYRQKIYKCRREYYFINSLQKKQQYRQRNYTLLNNSEQIIKVYNTQIYKIERNLELLYNIMDNTNKLNEDELIKMINKYNKKYNEIKKNITINFFNYEANKKNNYQKKIRKNYNVSEEIKEKIKEEIKEEVREKVKEEAKEEIIEEVSNDLKNDLANEDIPEDISNNSKLIDNSDGNDEIQNNDTLLISEILKVVILPYTGEEVLEILENENETYKTAEEVIKDRFTRPLSDYKFQSLSRYRETIKLLTVRQNYKLGESINLALEIMRKKFLHPSIISACRNLDELDVYLDCLEKNEVDDFKIFKIKYELHPSLVKNKGKNKKNKLLKAYPMKQESAKI